MMQFTARPLWQGLALAVVLGILAALGLAPRGLWGVTLLSLAVIAPLAMSRSAPRQAGAMGWGFGLGYFGHGLFWIVEPFLVDPDRHAWMAPFALFFMAAGLAMFWGAAFYLAARVAPKGWRRVWVLVATLFLAEFARAYILTGFPWAGLAQIWIDTPTAGLLGSVGPHGLGLLTLGASLPFAVVLKRGVKASSRILAIAPAFVLVAASFTLGTYAEHVEDTGKTVRLVQPNAPQDQKWDPAHIPTFFWRQIDYTSAEPQPDLIVWPETAVPTWLDESHDTLARIVEAAQGAPVVLGIRRSEGARIYNSLIFIDDKGEQQGLYDKHHLVPFGEYVPFGDFLVRFGIHGFAANSGQGFSAGPGPRLISLGALGKALPLICYEAVFPQDVSAAPGRPDVLLQLTNDAWFGQHSGPFQHLAQARMRAIEQGLPMIRVANTGISAMIDPYGRITSALPLGQAGYVDALLPAPLAPTIYARTGDFPVLFLVLLALSAWFLLQRRDQARNSN